MADEQMMSALDLTEVEAELCRLPDVTAVRLVADPIGRPVEVHVLAHAGKPAKQIVRDVQSVALASFGLEFDRRIVSVVQLSANGSRHVDLATTEEAVTRPRVVTVQAQSTGYAPRSRSPSRPATRSARVMPRARSRSRRVR